jgi:hypothetical protein
MIAIENLSKIFLPRFFLKNPDPHKKFSPEKNFMSQLYVQLLDIYPNVGMETDTPGSRLILFCRIIAC